ncbi:class IIb bacteriocin, lactobin A/cerein 7B family [Anoxybacillus sp. J5B_2022]|uniref:class IIb bacteriocin, lactobin A/cerein 7B family n=1 Tax=Anoxybacillus sp. J5B_2022 TaxID=3003246 RepID=UPI002285A6A7|nr:class IIb bacteriocin, lactobin A/cerein 7B family [Anoxybacillus sp. J5B_2022]MCZ0756016.1 class IIb bacteriocin, lactobin A/cerein 7B family [Anoxybacillus sp. J5B_2022]
MQMVSNFHLEEASLSRAGFGELQQEELEYIRGGVAPLIIYAVRIGGGAIIGATGGAIGSYIATGHVSGRAVVAGAVTGALGGAWGAWLKVAGL